jgi:hypothetical protein
MFGSRQAHRRISARRRSQLPDAIFVRVIGLEHNAEILVLAGIAHLDIVWVPA